MKRIIILALIGVCAGLTLAWLALQGGGYVLITWRNWVLDTTVGMALVLNIVFLAVLWLAIKVVGYVATMGGLRNWWRQLFNKRTQQKTQKGLQLFLQGQYQDAVGLLERSATVAENPDFHLLLAAESAAAAQQYGEALRLISLAEGQNKGKTLASCMTHARVLLQQRAFKQAADLLETLHRNEPSNKQVLLLLSEAHRGYQNWPRLQKLLQFIRKYRVYSEDKMLQLEAQVYSVLLRLSYWQQKDPTQTKDQLLATIDDYWQVASKEIRQHPRVLNSFCDSIVILGKSANAESILRKALSKKWDGMLAKKYLSFVVDDGLKQLQHAENWLQSHSDDAELLAGLGYFCVQIKLWGKAKDYFEQAIRVAPSAFSYSHLADLQQKLGNTDAAVACYKAALTSK